MTFMMPRKYSFLGNLTSNSSLIIIFLALLLKIEINKINTIEKITKISSLYQQSKL